MKFFKSITALSTFLVLASAVAVEHKTPASSLTVITSTDAKASQPIAVPSFSISKGGCDADDDADCTAYCTAIEQTASCAANGNKVTCYCKGAKTPESNCEERCLLCMPGKSALEEAKRIFKLGGTKIDEL